MMKVILFERKAEEQKEKKKEDCKERNGPLIRERGVAVISVIMMSGHEPHPQKDTRNSHHHHDHTDDS